MECAMKNDEISSLRRRNVQRDRSILFRASPLDSMRKDTKMKTMATKTRAPADDQDGMISKQAGQAKMVTKANAQ